MKKLFPVLMLMSLAGFSFFEMACDKNAPTQSANMATPPTTAPTSQPTTQAVSNGAINKFCAIETDNKIDPKGVTYTYKGKIIGFCCPDCVDTFKKDPEKYMATLK